MLYLELQYNYALGTTLLYFYHVRALKFSFVTKRLRAAPIFYLYELQVMNFRYLGALYYKNNIKHYIKIFILAATLIAVAIEE